MNHSNSIKAGYCPVIGCHTSYIAIKFEKLGTKRDRKAGKALKEEPKEIKKGESVIVFMEPQKSLICQTYTIYPPQSWFAVR